MLAAGGGNNSNFNSLHLVGKSSIVPLSLQIFALKHTLPKTQISFPFCDLLVSEQNSSGRVSHSTDNTMSDKGEIKNTKYLPFHLFSFFLQAVGEHNSNYCEESSCLLC